MYLFQQKHYRYACKLQYIYIPLCIYFNPNQYGYLDDNTFIYIPLCIYFNLNRQYRHCEYSLYLHSTMYLFQLSVPGTPILQRSNLHSTMYLFQPLTILQFLLADYKFTFHYVSISTKFFALRITINPIFTFHYVSISTPGLPKPYIY